MRKPLARLFDYLGMRCVDCAMWLDPDVMLPPSTDAIMAAIGSSEWRRSSTTHPEQAAVRIVELTQTPVFLAPTWALHDRQCFVIANQHEKTEQVQ